jgi:hypothetical protein
MLLLQSIDSSESCQEGCWKVKGCKAAKGRLKAPASST